VLPVRVSCLWSRHSWSSVFSNIARADGPWAHFYRALKESWAQ
jgi:hypothetical protein